MVRSNSAVITTLLCSSMYAETDDFSLEKPHASATQKKWHFLDNYVHQVLVLIPVNRELVFTGGTWQPGEPAMTREKQLQARERDR